MGDPNGKQEEPLPSTALILYQSVSARSWKFPVVRTSIPPSRASGNGAAPNWDSLGSRPIRDTTTTLDAPLAEPTRAVMITAVGLPESPRTLTCAMPLLANVVGGMATTPGRLADHSTTGLPPTGTPAALRSVAWSTTSDPTATVVVVGLRTIDATPLGSVTTIVRPPLTPSTVAVIVTPGVPASPVTRPLGDTVAASSSLDSHATSRGSVIRTPKASR